MKITLIGYGKMGQAVGKAALERGHTLVAALDQGWTESDIPSDTDVVIEFSSPEEAKRNIIRVLRLGMPIVSGTTGWLEEGMKEVKKEVAATNGTLFYSSNFSIGVYLFRQMVRTLSEKMNGFPGFSEVSMEEVHHIHKLDYPSGTALTVAKEDILAVLDRKKSVEAYLEPASKPETGEETLLIKSIREGEVAGIHRVEYLCPGVEAIRIEHESLGRESLAKGAVLAAEFAPGKKGFFGMDDLIKSNH